MDINGLIPDQVSGEEVDAKASLEFKDEVLAKAGFMQVSRRLLDVNHWHKIVGLVSGVFQLADEQGTPMEAKARQGCYIRIDIPGPGSNAGDGYDWVFIEQFGEVNEEHVQSIGFRVRPTCNPTGSTAIAHFYSAASSSSFIVSRTGKTVNVLIADRNLQPNDDTRSIIDSIRHTAVGMAAIGAFSKMQWQNLADGLIKSAGG